MKGRISNTCSSSPFLSSNLVFFLPNPRPYAVFYPFPPGFCWTRGAGRIQPACLSACLPVAEVEGRQVHKGHNSNLLLKRAPWCYC